jgi:hypothetical protein
MVTPLARSGIPRNHIGDYAAFTRATVLLEMGNYPAVAEIAAGLLERYPDHGEACYLLGCVALYQWFLPDKAEECFRKAVELRPNFPECWYNLGYTTQRLGGKMEQCIEHYRRCLELDPKFSGAWVNLGNAKLALGQFEEALDAYEKAKTADAGNTLARYNRAFAWLYTGEYAKGWEEYECRFDSPNFTRQRWMRPEADEMPMWDGSDQPGKHLLVVAEQGLGDTIMCWRYDQELRTRFRQVTWAVQPPLLTLFGHAPYTPPWPEADCWVASMSLHHRLGQPTSGPAYLRSPVPRKLPRDRPRVGYVYAGGKLYENDHRRSIDPALWADLLATPGVEWVSLQYGEGYQPSDWAQTMDDVAQLDLVISVDTAVAHLAGALGVPVWILLPAWPDYRWGLKRETTPWYDSARLLRATGEGAWPDLLARTKRELEKWKAII